MADDPLILSFDTATPCCSVALTSGGLDRGSCLAELSFTAGVTHSRRLLGSIDWLLNQVSRRLEDVAAVAVGLGPGSFTGLRIGLATAKGLIFGTAVPLIGISSLDSIAARLPPTDKLICAALDARKAALYFALYKGLGDTVLQRLIEPAVCSLELLATTITEPVIMAGNVSCAQQRKLATLLAPEAQFLGSEHQFPSAKIMGFLADGYYQKKRFMAPESATPLYVRASDAELSLIDKPR